MSNCKKCGKHILQPNTTYGINPNAVCNCSEPQKSEANNLEWLDEIVDKNSGALTIGEGDRSEILRVINPTTLKLAITAKINEMLISELENLLPQATHVPYRTAICKRIESLRKRKDEVLK